MKTATFITDVSDRFNGTAHLFQVSPPVSYDPWAWDDDESAPTTEFVVASALTAAFDTGVPETFLFPTDESGHVLSWTELPESQRFTTDIDAVLAEAGYEVTR